MTVKDLENIIEPFKDSLKIKVVKQVSPEHFREGENLIIAIIHDECLIVFKEEKRASVDIPEDENGMCLRIMHGIIANGLFRSIEETKRLRSRLSIPKIK